MRKMWSKLVFMALGILSVVGMGTASATVIPPGTQQITEVNHTTPLYLHLGIEMASSLDSQKANLEFARHYNHWSHSAHSSHYAHYSHRAHYSHYNYYR